MTTYEEAGVNIGEGRRAVDLIRPLVETTFPFLDGEILSGIGGFCAIIELPDGTIMGVEVDGVGTKLMIAALLGRLGKIGIDLVAANVNDVEVMGINARIFCNYIAMGKQSPEETRTIVQGMVDGCREARVALVGGEMAEMPGMYREGQYDLAGFAIGFAESRKKLITGARTRSGMKVYGFPASGVHANGLSLVRKAFGIHCDESGVAEHVLGVYYPSLGTSLGEELLKPTIIYTELIRMLRARYDIAGFAPVTGGGLVDNPPRILPDGCAMVIKLGSWRVPPIFGLVQKKGGVPQDEMFQDLNMGIGLLAVTHDDLTKFGEECFLIGEIVKGGRKDSTSSDLVI